jgi:hypothetical protein
LGEFGIAPQTLHATTLFAAKVGGEDPGTGRKHKLDEETGETTHPLTRLWDGMATPTSESIGTKLLKKMGWRVGWGIGPRTKAPGSKTYGHEKPSNEKWDDDDDSSG